MSFQFVLLAALVAVSTASVVPGYATNIPAPVVAAPIARTVVAEPYDPNPHYSFGYDVQDPYTGDSHGQVETRSGDFVTGSYNLLEADGSRRVVNYQADPINGFNAVVSKQPGVIAAAPAIARVAPIAAPAVYSAPVPAPILRSAPIAPVVPSGPWAAAPAVRASLPVAPWQGQGSPIVRSGPLW